MLNFRFWTSWFLIRKEILVLPSSSNNPICFWPLQDSEPKECILFFLVVAICSKFAGQESIQSLL
jgi:hypothetical protein